MHVQTIVARYAEVSSPALVVGLPDDPALPVSLHPLDQALDGLLSRLLGSGALRGSSDAGELFHTMGKLPAERLLLAGLGKAADFDLKRALDWSARVARRARRAGVTEIALALPSVAGASPSEVTAVVVEGLELGARDFLKYKSADGEPSRELKSASIVVESEEAAAAVSQGLVRGLAIAEGMTFARELGNEPGNVATPTFLAERAREMAAARGITCRILDPKEMATLGMGALLGVARGSEEPARFIVLELEGKEAGPTIALIGKGLTFDSGGISIKPAANMHEMKYDMCGGAAVMGSLLALSRLNPSGKVIGLVPASENLPSGKAVKPGDILKSMSGLTIEVTNTDAEGRLILADALTYSRRYHPDAVIDIATLTGAIVVALGAHAIGCMGNDSTWVEQIRASGMRAGERVWPLPMWKEYLDAMKSDCADLVNSSNAGGKAITAAAFLSRFAEGMRWAHLDIAGTAWSEGSGEKLVQGATGSGVRTMVEAVLSYKA